MCGTDSSTTQRLIVFALYTPALHRPTRSFDTVEDVDLEEEAEAVWGDGEEPFYLNVGDDYSASSRSTTQIRSRSSTQHGLAGAGAGADVPTGSGSGIPTLGDVRRGD